MKIKIILTVVAIILGISANAQLNWAKTFDNCAGDYPRSIAIGTNGNVYTAGYFEQTLDLDPGPSTYCLSSSGFNAYVLKLDASGNFSWAQQLGIGSGTAGAQCVATDAMGNTFTTGFFAGTGDFDPGMSSYTLVSAGAKDIFVVKLDALGSLVWARSIGGSSTADDIGYSIDVDNAGNVYFTGCFAGIVDFDPGIGVSNLTAAGSGSTDIFVCKLDPNGNFVWAKNMGGTGNDYGFAITIDGLGDVLTNGGFSGTADFDPGASISNLTGSGIFVSKLNSSGNFVWAKRFGGGNSTYGQSLAIDATNNVYITGNFTGTEDFDPGLGIYNITATGSSQAAFVSKLDLNGNFIWAKAMDGALNMNGNCIDVDPVGGVYTTGVFQGTMDFNPGLSVYNLSDSGGNIFISQLDLNGNFVSAGQIGKGGTSQTSNCIKSDPNGFALVTGSFNGASGQVDFDPGPIDNNLTGFCGGGFAIYLIKFGAIPLGIPEIGFLNTAAIYPNPNQGAFRFQVHNGIKDAELILINSLGQKVFVKKINEGTSDIETHGLAKGIYTFILYSDKQTLSAGKLVIE